MAAQPSSSPIVSQELLLHVADQLKMPLQQIARQAELGQLHQSADLTAIQSTADMAMQLLDSYAMGVRVALEPGALEFEPVSVSSVLYDTANRLDALAKNYGVRLEMDVAGKLGPVLTNRQVLQSALVSLGAAIIEALPALESRQLKLQLATHGSRYGVVAGLYCDSDKLTTSTLAQARRLHGKSRQPFLGLSHTSGAGIFVAESILQAMELKLLASRHHKLYGFGTVLQPNPQLMLV
jgi:hypothetical protein